MDWNWFYSAIAQSAAAIVGIFAAFIITKIVNNQSIFDQQCYEGKSLLRESERLRDLIGNLYIGRFNKQIRSSVLSDIPTFLSVYAHAEANPEKTFSGRLVFFPYDRQAEIIEDIAKQITLFNNSLYVNISGKHEKRPEPMIEPDFSVDNASLKNIEATATTLTYTKHPSEQQKAIDSFRIEVEHLTKRIEHFRDEHLHYPQSSPLIAFSIIMVMILFLVGVMAPLYLLPIATETAEPLYFSDISLPTLSNFSELFVEVSQDWKSVFMHISLKDAVLAIVMIIFTLIMGRFFSINHSLRMEKELLEKLRQSADYSFYSEYLRNYYDKDNTTIFQVKEPKSH